MCWRTLVFYVIFHSAEICKGGGIFRDGGILGEQEDESKHKEIVAPRAGQGRAGCVFVFVPVEVSSPVN